MHIWIEQFVQMSGTEVSRGMDVLVFICLRSPISRKIQWAICPNQSGRTAMQSKECSCIPTSHICERKHPYPAFLWENAQLVAQCFSTSKSLQVQPYHGKHGQIRWRRSCFERHYEAIAFIWPHFEDSLSLSPYLSQVVCLSFKSWLCRIPQESWNASRENSSAVPARASLWLQFLLSHKKHCVQTNEWRFVFAWSDLSANSLWNSRRP